MKLILADMTEIEITSYTWPLSIVKVVENTEEMFSVWNTFTEERLTSVRIVDENEATIAKLKDAVFTGGQGVVNPAGNITAHFYFSAKPDIEADAEYTEAAKILLGEVE